MAEYTEELLSKLTIEGDLNAKDFVRILLFEDDSDVEDIRKKFKKNFLDKFKNALDDVTTKDIKQIFDPLSLTSLLRDKEEIRDEFKKYKQKLKRFLKKANEDLASRKKQNIDDADDETITPPAVPNKSVDVNNNSNISEQQEFGPKAITVELGDKTNRFLTDLFLKFKADKLDDLKKNQNNKPDDKNNKGGGGILDLLGYAIAGGLLFTFWESHIRPFLEEKFDFMGRLEGTFNAIEKGLYGFVTKFLSGGINIAGTVFKTVGELAEGLINGVVKMFTGGVGIKALAEGGAKAANFLPNVAKTIGAGLLKTLKFIPVIGALVSFGFAWDRFKKGDNVGGIIDMVGGLGSLLYLVPGAQPIAAALNWGALALNAILDMSAEGKTEEEKGKDKMDKLKEWIKAPVKWLMGIPFIKRMFNTFSGLAKLATGDFIGAAKDLRNGWFSGLADTFLLFGEDKSENVEIDQKYTPIKFEKSKRLKEFNIEEGVEEGRGYTMKQRQLYVGETNKVQQSNKNTTDQNQIKENEEYLKFLEEQIEKIDEADAKLAKGSKIRKNKTEEQNHNWPTHNQKMVELARIPKVDDGEISYNPELKVGNNTIARFNTQDKFSIAAAKPDGMFSEMNKMLTQQMENLNKQFSDMSKNFLAANAANNNSYVNINNVSGSGNSGMNYNLSDPVLRNRSSYLQQPMRFA